MVVEDDGIPVVRGLARTPETLPQGVGVGGAVELVPVPIPDREGQVHHLHIVVGPDVVNGVRGQDEVHVAHALEILRAGWGARRRGVLQRAVSRQALAADAVREELSAQDRPDGSRRQLRQVVQPLAPVVPRSGVHVRSMIGRRTLRCQPGERARQQQKDRGEGMSQ